MAKPIKTPGVYIVEKNAFANSVVEVDTAVPVFIGYTQKAEHKGTQLTLKPIELSSLNEFHDYFGSAQRPSFHISTHELSPADDTVSISPEAAVIGPPAGPNHPNVTFGNVEYQFNQDDGLFLLYPSLRLFFGNGGGRCLVVSVGTYEGQKVDKKRLLQGIPPLCNEQAPTVLVIPEAVRLPRGECAEVQQAMLAHCEEMANRVSILDVHNGFVDASLPLPGEERDVITQFRADIGDHGLKYGAAYYPWIETGVLGDHDIGIEHISDKATMRSLLTTELTQNGFALSDAPVKEVLDEVNALSGNAAEFDDVKRAQVAALNDTLREISPVFNEIVGALKAKLNLLPPSGAIAGIYARVDRQRGVWMAPANVAVNMATKPAVSISHDEQQDLNVHPTGKSINAIRSFIGEGTVVWGARTLDGNSSDWRYVNVRRTMIMLEESVRQASKASVFEPNTANTWVTIKSMITNFLMSVWKRGGLAGAAPEEAFSVHVGLGETMTPQDIVEGILRVTVLVAPTRPAEFIEVTFQQQQQKS